MMKNVVRAAAHLFGHAAAHVRGGLHGLHGASTAAQPFPKKQQLGRRQRLPLGLAADGVHHVVSGALLPVGVHARHTGAFGHAAALYGDFIPVAVLAGQGKRHVGPGKALVGLAFMSGFAENGRGKRRQIDRGRSLQRNGKTTELFGVHLEHVRHLRVGQRSSPRCTGGAFHFLNKGRRIHAIKRFQHAGREHVVQNTGTAFQRIALHAAQRAGIAVPRIRLHQRDRTAAPASLMMRRNVLRRQPARHVAHEAGRHHGIPMFGRRRGSLIRHLAGRAVAVGRGCAVQGHGAVHSGQKFGLRIHRRGASLGRQRGSHLPGRVFFSGGRRDFGGRSGIAGLFRRFSGQMPNRISGGFHRRFHLLRQKIPCGAAKTAQNQNTRSQLAERTG